ncbi:MAG: FtsX-like permease family protein [Oscillospiraceae bacterium]|jgi:putative ABC transport system permease protein|nr:FtsX-like permease family protein [Oscillospiraceae bacterium]
MLAIVLGKIRNNFKLALCLLIGNILLIAAVCSIPVYSEAITQRVFMKELENVQLTTGRYPGRLTLGLKSSQAKADGTFERIDGIVANELSGDFGAEVQSANRITSTLSYDFIGGEGLSKASRKRAGLRSETLFPAEIFEGSAPLRDIGADKVISAVVSEDTYISMNLALGDRFILKGFSDGYSIEITGVFRGAAGYNNVFVINDELMQSLFASEKNYRNVTNVEWVVNLDYYAFRIYNSDELLATLESYSKLADSKNYSFSARFAEVLTPFPEKARNLNLTLWILEAPLFILLIFFISMVARQILTLDRNEISVLKSRGATRPQIFQLYLLMNGTLALVSLIIGVPLGFLICSLLGASGGFLEFVNRSALGLRLQPFALGLACLTAFGSVLITVLPSIPFSKITIVAHKLGKAHRRSPLWQKLFLDVLLLAFSLYEWYSFSARLDALNGSLAVDPLLFVSSSLFMLGAGLLFVRLFGYVIRLVYAAVGPILPPSLYSAFMKVMRSSGDEQFIMLFLVLTLSTGIFNSSIARTVNLNNDNALRYSIGADTVVKEEWKINARHSVTAVNELGDLYYKEKVYYEPDFNRYSNAPDAEAATKVYRDTAAEVRYSTQVIKDTTVMGVISNEFGNVAWLRGGLLPQHFYNYLNILAENPEAVLISVNLAEDYGLKKGDRLQYTTNSKTYYGVVSGVVAYWPGFEPSYTQIDYDGVATVNHRSLIVSGLGYMQQMNGIQPYEVWIKTDGQSPKSLYAAAESGNVTYERFTDLNAELINSKNNPVFQGTNGVLTVSFLIVLVVCAAGFLIYWILSIRSRELQFGIFRAMGLTLKELISMLLCEQVLLSGTSIATGIAVGLITSKLFVPLIQVGYATGSPLPLVVASETNDGVRLLVITGAILLLCMAVLWRIVSTLKIAQALKLGED